MTPRLGLALVSTLASFAAHAQTARLQHAGWLTGDAPLASTALAQVDRSQLTREQLLAEYDQLNPRQLTREKRRLADDLPGLGGPIWVMIGGASVTVISIIALLGTPTALVPAVVMIVLGAAVLGLGIFWLINRLETREESLARIAELDDRLRNPRQREAPEPLPEAEPPPPPPLPPLEPMLLNAPPPPQLLLARF
jgi:hypothetical protein